MGTKLKADGKGSIGVACEMTSKVVRGGGMLRKKIAPRRKIERKKTKLGRNTKKVTKGRGGAKPGV